MDKGDSGTGGWGVSICHLGESLLGLAASRVALFVDEVQEEKLRALATLVRVALAVGLLVAGLLVGLGALALYLWTLASYLGLLGLALVAGGAGAGVLWHVRNTIRTAPGPFAATLEEFRKDRQCLRDMTNGTN